MRRLAPLFRQIRLLALAAGLTLATASAMAETATEHGTAATGHAAAPLEPGPAGGPGVEGFEEGVHAAEHGGGLPQLDALTFPSQIFWLIVCFATLYYLLSKRALPRVGDILEARQERIAADLDRAAQLARRSRGGAAEPSGGGGRGAGQGCGRDQGDPGPARGRGGAAPGPGRRRSAAAARARPRRASVPRRMRRWARSRTSRPRWRRRRCAGWPGWIWPRPTSRRRSTAC